jgi:ribosomal protein L40E
MEQVCHRCGGALNSADTFCPHCGAPQLRYEASEEPAPYAPAQRLTARNPNEVQWRDAIIVAALVAVPAGLLSARLGGLEALWAIAGGMMIVSLYRRRTGALPTSKMGWRIGALLGLFAAAIATTAEGITLDVQRYALHQGAVLDQNFREIIETNAKLYASFFGNSNPDFTAALAESQHFWLTPDGAAAMVLINAAGVVIFMLLFAALGGALGARLTQKTAQPSAR